MRITKEEFVKVINAILEQYHYDCNWSNKVGELFLNDSTDDLSYNNILMYDAFLYLLESLTGDEDTNIINYYISLRKCWAEEVGYTFEDGTKVILKTPEDLYDLLESQSKSSN